jgi:hypothetical protein
MAVAEVQLPAVTEKLRDLCIPLSRLLRKDLLPS